VNWWHKATEVMRRTVAHINECQKSLDLQQSLVGKQARLLGSPRKSLLLQPQRKFIREGPLRLSKSGNPEAFIFYLFSDALVWTTLEHVFQGERLLVSVRLPSESRMTEAGIQPELVISLDMAKQDADFTEFSNLDLICGSVTEKEEWEGPLRAAIDIAWKRKMENDINCSKAKRKREDTDQGPRRSLSIRARGSGGPVERTLDFSSATKVSLEENACVAPELPLSAPPLPLSAPPLRFSSPPPYDQPKAFCETISPFRAPSKSSTPTVPDAPPLVCEPTPEPEEPKRNLLEEIRGGFSLKKTRVRSASQAPRVILKAKRHSTTAVPAESARQQSASLAETLAEAISARRKTIATESHCDSSSSEDWD